MIIATFRQNLRADVDNIEIRFWTVHSYQPHVRCHLRLISFYLLNPHGHSPTVLYYQFPPFSTLKMPHTNFLYYTVS